MSYRDKPPYRPQNVGEVQNLVIALESHKGRGKGKGGFSIKKATFTLPSGRQVDSWRMQDWDYKKDNLPTYARGLFTCTNLSGRPEIVVRGYDKFFNHGEVRKTEWDNVEKNTRGPYELSVKENGCIIFISGMDDGNLIVCSKHSTGERSDTDKSHAVVGERWIEKQLTQIGKTKEDLARTLREMNATAVAELCDDEFEEHVLAYGPDVAGLYLHGINLNLPEFVTYPGHLIDKFAEEWGFKKIMYLMMDDISQVKPFLDGVAETGSYAGRDTEGFVIRCQARDAPDAPWHDWFFKYKFEEPYLMYREWRECTKAVIAGRKPKIHKHKKITEQYLQYARTRLAKEPRLGKLYNQNHGIIALRDDFLASQGVKGSDIIRREIESGEAVKDVTNNVVLVPIATIGCGKTTIALALCKLFGWGHFQNDNIQGGKNRPQRFAQAVCIQLASHSVVIADRNNHQKRERQQLIKDISETVPNVTFVALHFVHEPSNFNNIRQALRDRVISRGDNHQTIQAQSDPGKFFGIMDGFLNRFEPVDEDIPPDRDFDLVINLDPIADSRENLETVISALHSEYPKLFQEEMPTAADLDDAIEAAMNDYKPETKHDLSKTFEQQDRRNSNRNQQQRNFSTQTNSPSINQPNGSLPFTHQPPKKQKPLNPIYFGITLPPDRINGILAAMFRDASPETARFYRQLLQTRRIQPEFHVTLIHSAQSPNFGHQWQALNAHYDRVARPAVEGARDEGTAVLPEPELGKVKVQLERLVWNERVMCFVVRLMPVVEGKEGENDGGEVEGLFACTNKVPHVTVGTATRDIKPKESNDLLERWLDVGSGMETGIWEEKLRGTVVLEGSVRGVLGR